MNYMKSFEIVDISGDAGIRAYGETLDDVFVNAAIGMYSLITELEDVREEKEIQVDVQSHSPESLLVSWLNELIFHFDTYGFIGKRIIISDLSPCLALPPGGGGLGEGEVCSLRASVFGEEFDPVRHERKLLVKAATYHQLIIEKKDGVWVTEVIFDI